MRNWLKRNYYRLANYTNKVKIGKRVELNINNTFDGLNVIGDDAIIGSSHIGLGTYIAERSIIKDTRIGKFCSVGSFVQTGMGIHPSSGFVSTHPAFFSTQMQAGFSFVTENTFEEHVYARDNWVADIGNDVWIGNNVIIMDGVTVGNGAIIAAGAIVTKDVAPYTIVGGIPAKFIKERFLPEQVQALENIKWWDRSIDELRSSAHLFNNIEQFLGNAGPHHHKLTKQ